MLKQQLRPNLNLGRLSAFSKVFLKVEQFRAAQRLLTQQRYQFPNSWLYSENVDGEWSALSDILERKDSAIQAQVCYF